jgi:hypothetical protein
MKKLFVVMSTALLMLGVGTSRSFAQNPTLQELSFNTDITSATPQGFYDSADGVCPGAGCGYPNFYTSEAIAANGYNLSGYNTSSGLGTITYTVVNPSTSLSATTSFFDVFIDEEVGTDFTNEYGTQGGTASSGETWEIGGNYSSSIVPDFIGNSLADANNLPSGATNIPSSECGTYTVINGASVQTDSTGCNGDATIALGLAFSVDPGYEETISVDVVTGTSCSDPGVCLTQYNTTANTNYSPVSFSLNENTTQIGAVGPVTPEPSSWLLLATGLVGVGMIQVRRKHLAQGIL